MKLDIYDIYEVIKDQYNVTKPICAFVDFSLPSTEKRFTIYDVETEEVLYNTWCAHGSGSGVIIPNIFSNINNSHMTSLGVYRVGSTYNGKYGRSCLVEGLEPGFNDKARSRAIVIHGSNYIGNGKTGRSWGCFALPMDKVQKAIDLLKDGAFLVAYYPDKNWLNNSKILND